MNLELNYNIRPLAHQSVKLTKTGHTYTPKNVKKYKAEIVKQTKLQLPKTFKIIDLCLCDSFGSLVMIKK